MDSLLSKYSVLVEYIGKPLDNGLRPLQKFEGTLSMNIDMGNVILKLPLPDLPILKDYKSIADFEIDWKVIERRVFTK